MIITIIDYKAGNIGSVQKAVRQLGYEALMTEDPERDSQGRAHPSARRRTLQRHAPPERVGHAAGD